MSTFIHRLVSPIAASLCAFALSGCAGSPDSSGSARNSSAPQQWSSKSESTLSELPDRPELDLGPAFAITVNEANLRGSAIGMLQEAIDSTNPLLRMNAIMGLKFVPELAPDAIRKGLGDDNRAVRFVSTMLVGEMKLTNMRPLVEPLLKDESESVQAAAIYAVKRCGGKPPMNRLSAMLLGEDNPDSNNNAAEVKGNAALVLGELGDPSAISLLKYALGRGLLKASSARRKMVELQISEALVKLGDMQQLEVIRAALFSRPEEGEIVALACQICGEVKDEGALPNLLDLATRTGRMQQAAEVRMAAALAVARINPQRAILAVPEGYVSSSRFELRSQAAYTIGGCKQVVALPILARMMTDTNPLVQVSAAAAILEIEP